jgi:hypothetical protein
MKNISTEIFMSRIMPCENCRKKGFPKKDQLFVVFGGRSKKYKVREVQSDVKTANQGLTPHFVQCFGLNKAGDGVVIVSNCCIDGCEIDLKWDSKKGTYEIIFKTVNARVLSIPDWEALIQRWHGGTGYEL